MGQYFDRESLLTRKRQFEAYAEWERAHPDAHTPEQALEITAQLCAIFPPPPQGAPFNPDGIARMHWILSHLREPARG